MYMIAEVSQYVAVASFAEAWIEIAYHSKNGPCNFVASFAEAWIEIRRTTYDYLIYSRLLRGGVD